MKQVGFIRLGDMGFPMAKNLVGQNFEVVVFDQRPEPMAEFSGLGATAATSNREVGEKCEMIGVCVQNDGQVKAVMAGEDGILKGTKPDTIAAIHSTVHPKTVRKLAGIAAGQGVGVIDVAITRALTLPHSGPCAIWPVVMSSWRSGAGKYLRRLHQRSSRQAPWEWE